MNGKKILVGLIVLLLLIHPAFAGVTGKVIKGGAVVAGAATASFFGYSGYTASTQNEIVLPLSEGSSFDGFGGFFLRNKTDERKIIVKSDAPIEQLDRSDELFWIRLDNFDKGWWGKSTYTIGGKLIESAGTGVGLRPKTVTIDHGKTKTIDSELFSVTVQPKNRVFFMELEIIEIRFDKTAINILAQDRIQTITRGEVHRRVFGVSPPATPPATTSPPTATTPPAEPESSVKWFKLKK